MTQADAGTYGRPSTLTGTLLSVRQRPAGTETTEAALAGGTTLLVADNAGIQAGVQIVLTDPDAVTSAPLTVAIAIDSDLVVLVDPLAQGWPVGTTVTIQPVQTETTGLVRLEASIAAVPCRVHHTLALTLTPGVRDEATAETVVLERIGSALQVVDVVDRTPIIDGDSIDPDTLPDTGPGQTFSPDPPTDTDGYAEGHVWWQVVDDEVVGFWRLAAGVWAPAEIVSVDALVAKNALITALQTVDLSAVNFQAVNIDGGSIAIATTSTGSFPQAFSGVSFPPGWTNTKTNATGTGSGDPAIPGASVVTSGPLGQDGSAILFDIPATAGRTGTSGAVTTSVPPTADAEVSLRYWIDRSPRVNLHLAVRQQGLPNGFDEDFVGVDLSGDLGAFHIVSRVNGDDVRLATIDLGTTASILGRWLRVRFRIIAGQVQLKVWRDADPEPEDWTVAQQAGVLTPGNIALEWWVVPPSAGSGLDYTQQFWVDQLDVVTYATGFKVNPDGTGEWPSFAAALLNSPALTGTPTAPTPPPGDDDVSIATTEYVQGELAGTDWTDITPASPFTAVSTQPPRWRIDGAGNVHIRGAVNRVTATSGVTVFTLPAEARPTGLVAVPVRTNAVGTVGQLTVNVDGTVVLTFAGTPSALGLEIVFSTHANPV